MELSSILMLLVLSAVPIGKLFLKKTSTYTQNNSTQHLEYDLDLKDESNKPSVSLENLQRDSVFRKERMRSGLAVTGFSRQQYAIDHPSVYGVWNSGISMDKRDIHIYGYKKMGYETDHEIY